MTKKIATELAVIDGVDIREYVREIGTDDIGDYIRFYFPADVKIDFDINMELVKRVDTEIDWNELQTSYHIRAPKRWYAGQYVTAYLRGDRDKEVNMELDRLDRRKAAIPKSVN